MDFLRSRVRRLTLALLAVTTAGGAGAGGTRRGLMLFSEVKDLPANVTAERFFLDSSMAEVQNPTHFRLTSGRGIQRQFRRS